MMPRPLAQEAREPGDSRGPHWPAIAARTRRPHAKARTPSPRDARRSAPTRVQGRASSTLPRAQGARQACEARGKRPNQNAGGALPALPLRAEPASNANVQARKARGAAPHAPLPGVRSPRERLRGALAPAPSPRPAPPSRDRPAPDRPAPGNRRRLGREGGRPPPSSSFPQRQGLSARQKRARGACNRSPGGADKNLDTFGARKEVRIMYSDADKKHALDLWFERLGQISLRDFVEELGWPSRSTMSKWIRADPRHDPDKATYKSKPVLTKLEAIRRVAEGATCEEAGREVGMAGHAVRDAVDRYARGGTAELLPKPRPRKGGGKGAAMAGGGEGGRGVAPAVRAAAGRPRRAARRPGGAQGDHRRPEAAQRRPGGGGGRPKRRPGAR